MAKSHHACVSHSVWYPLFLFLPVMLTFARAAVVSSTDFFDPLFPDLRFLSGGGGRAQ